MLHIGITANTAKSGEAAGCHHARPRMSDDRMAPSGFFDLLKSHVPVDGSFPSQQGNVAKEVKEVNEVNKEVNTEKNTQTEYREAQIEKPSEKSPEEISRDSTNPAKRADTDAQPSETTHKQSGENAPPSAEAKSSDAKAQPHAEIKKEEKIAKPEQASRKQSPRQMKGIDFSEFSPALQKLIDLIPHERAEGREIRQAAIEVRDLLRDREQSHRHRALNDALTRLNAVMKKIDRLIRNPQDGASVIPDASTVKQVRAERNHKGQERGKWPPADHQDVAMPQIREVLKRVESILEGLKAETRSNREGSEGRTTEMPLSGPAKEGDAASARSKAHEAIRASADTFRQNLHQIIENARVVLKDRANGSFSIRLHPAELGRLTVQMGLHDGVIHGRFLVESTQARDLLLENLEQIHQQLRDAGIAVGDFQVSVNDHRPRMARNEQDLMPIPSSEPEAEDRERDFAAHARPYHEGIINLVI